MAKKRPTKPTLNDELRAAIRPFVGDRIIQDVANASGVNRSSISNWLNGNRTLPLDSIEAIARAVGCSLTVQGRAAEAGPSKALTMMPKAKPAPKPKAKPTPKPAPKPVAPAAPKRVGFPVTPVPKPGKPSKPARGKPTTAAE